LAGDRHHLGIQLRFGEVRRGRSTRVKWLDLHNLLGIVTLTWAGIIGLTGVLNELATPMFGLWLQTDVKALLAPYHGQPSPRQSELSSVQKAYEVVQKAERGRALTSVVFPGNPFGSPQHYLIWTKGDSPLTRRLFTPVLVDARSGELHGVVNMPWYLRALEVSRPLHFGDYGGMPLKIIWAVLDGITLIVLGSGLYLWIARRQANEQRLEKLVSAAGTMDAPAAVRPTSPAGAR